jgi:magnesium transporter
LDLENQKVYFKELDERYGQSMLPHMSADDLADFLGELPEHVVEAFLEVMGQEGDHVKRLLAYPPQTAGAIMTTEFIAVTTHDLVNTVMQRLKKLAPSAETIYYLYVVDQTGQLVGVVSLRDLIVAHENQRIEEIMSTRVVSVSVLEDQEQVATVIQKYDFLAVPVVNEQGRLVGIVTVDDVMDVVEEEVTEDISEMSAARGAVDLQLSSFEAAKKRAPWILLLMLMGLLTAAVFRRYEATLDQVTILAIFTPMIMGSAGNTSTQTLAVVVRSLALGSIDRVGIYHLLRRELGTGVLLGFICSVILMIVIPLFYGNLMLGLIVAVSLLAALSMATIIGAVIPLVINKLKIDPAIASGPFITTLNDIIGLMIYFSIATALLNYL